MSALADVKAISEEYSVRRARDRSRSPFRIHQPPKGVMPESGPTMAMDDALSAANEFATSDWMSGNPVAAYAEEGLVFPGYPYLAEMAQRPEYRVISETIADDATRKWIDFDVTGDEKEAADRKRKDPVGEAERMADPDERKKRIKAAGKGDRVKALKDDQDRLEVRDRFYEMSRLDGFFGRAHLYIDLAGAEGNANELATPIGNGRNEMSKGKIGKKSLLGLKAIEPVWTYPMAYNAINPLKPNWYKPDVWYVMGQQVHGSRLIPFIGHPVPDLLKPAYSFGGLSMTQMAKPYVDIWLQTRQSVADLIKSFSVMVLMTDLSTILAPGNAGALLARVAMFNMLRDNQGTFVVNEATEDFKNVSASLSGLHELQAQSQEHMAAVSRIPLVKLLGISPTGLNASSEGEIQVYYDTISGYQNRFFRANLETVINIQQLSLFGNIDPELTWHFEPLHELTEAERGEKEKNDADRNQKYVDMGAIAPGEIRKVIIDDPTLPYTGLDPEDVPDLAAEEDAGLEPQGGHPQDGGAPENKEAGGQDAALPFGGTDEWKESDHPRAPDGKFGKGGGTAYHGTENDFTKFDPKRMGERDEGYLGRGFYFSTDVNIGRTNKNTMKVDLSVKNPLEIEMKDFATDKRKVVREALGLGDKASAAEVTEALRKNGYDAVVLDMTPLGYKHQEIMIPDVDQIKYEGHEKGGGGGGGGNGGGSSSSPQEMSSAESSWNDYGIGSMIKQASAGQPAKAGDMDLNGSVLTEADASEINKNARILQAAAESELIKSERMGVWRGIALPEGTDVKSLFRHNSIIDFPSLTAVSQDKSIAEKYTDPQFLGEETGERVLINIQRRGGVIGHSSSDAEFDEAIMPAGAKYRVSSFKKSSDGTYLVTLYDNGTLNKLRSPGGDATTKSPINPKGQLNTVEPGSPRQEPEVEEDDDEDIEDISDIDDEDD